MSSNTSNLENHRYYQKPNFNSQAEEVAYRLAKEAHEDQFRSKRGGINLPYITHINIIHRMLKHAGVEDTITLCAAILHDVIEDCKDQNGNRVYDKDSLTVKFQNLLEENNIDDAGQIAKDSVSIVDEVSNPETFNDKSFVDKRSWQTKKLSNSSNAAKLVKIADQTASMVDDIVYPSNRNDMKLISYAFKARDVSISCYDGDNEINKCLIGMMNAIFNYDISVINAAENCRTAVNYNKYTHENREFSADNVQQWMRDNFRMSEMKEIGKDSQEEPLLFCIHGEQKQLSSVESDFPLKSIGISHDGQVCSVRVKEFGDVENDSKDIEKLMINLRSLLEMDEEIHAHHGIEPLRCITTRHNLSDVEDGVVEYHITPPVHPSLFQEKAREALLQEDIKIPKEVTNKYNEIIKKANDSSITRLNDHLGDIHRVSGVGHPYCKVNLNRYDNKVKDKDIKKSK